MATKFIDVTIHIETCLAQVAENPPAFWLGGALMVSCGPVPDELTSAHAAWTPLMALLSPWRWQNATWQDGPPPPTAQPPKAITDEADAVLAEIFSGRQWARLSQMGSDTDADEARPQWLTLLAQLGRLPAEFTHPLQLGFAYDIVDVGAYVEPRLSMLHAADLDFTVGAATLFGDIGIRLLVETAPSPTLTQLTERPGLINGLTRRVASSSTGGAIGTVHNWMANLDEQIGAAFHPVLRLADVSDEAPGGDLAVLDAAASKAFTRLLEALDAPVLQAVAVGDRAALLAGDKTARLQVEDFARAWASEWVQGRPGADELDARLDLSHFAQGIWPLEAGAAPPADWAAELSGYLQGSDHRPASDNTPIESFRDRVRRRLTALIPTGNAAGYDAARAAAQATLAEPRRVDGLFTVLMPMRAAVTFRNLVVAGAAAAADTSDVAALRQAFIDLFKTEFTSLMGWAGGGPFDAAIAIVAARQAASLAATPEAVDAAALGGLCFRADSVLGPKTEVTPGAGQFVDLHSRFDGFMAAVRRSKLGLPAINPDVLSSADNDWEDFELVTRAKLAVNGTLLADDLGVALPVALELDPAAQGGAGDNEVRHAIVTYDGRALYPVATPLDATAEQPVFKLEYGPTQAKTDLPQLAYGQVYQAAIGYRSLGGILPLGFGEVASPTTLPSAAPLKPDGPLKTGVILRTLPPGPPRLEPPVERPHIKLNAILTKPDDAKVKPLWVEWLRRWSDEPARARFRGATTCFLDALTPGREDVEFDLRPPVLALGGKNEPHADTRFNDQVWAYWQNRTAEHLGQPPLASPLNQDVDDPAVVEIPHGATDPLGRGGVWLEIVEMTRTGPVSARPRQRVRLAGQGARRRVKVICQTGAVAATVVENADTLTINLPPARQFAVSFRTCIDRDYLPGGSDPRISSAIVDPTLTDRPWAAPVGKDVDGTYLFGEATLVFECLPALDHLPTSLELFKALSIEEIGDSAVARFKPRGAVGEPFIGSLRTWRQTWRWDGGPIPDDDWKDEAGSTLTGLAAAFGGAGGDVAESGVRPAKVVAFEQSLFQERGQSGSEANAPYAADADGIELFRLELPADRGADWLRLRLQAISRYAPLRSRADPDGANLKRAAQASGARPIDEWFAHGLKLKRRTPLPTPKVRVAAPIFGKVGADVGHAGGFNLYLDETAYDVRSGGGLAERVVAEVIIETVERDLTVTPPIPGLSRQLAVGMDPILSGKGQPYLGQSNPIPPTEPSANLSARFRRAAVLGETLEPNSPAPILPFASVMFDPVLEAGAASAPLRPGTMARIRLRTEALAELCGSPGEAQAAVSEWSAPVWVQMMSDMDYDGELNCQVTTAGGVSSFTLSPKVAGATVFERWIERATEDALPAPSRPTGPQLSSGLVAVIGLVVTDIAGAQVLRPRAAVRGRLNGPAKTLTFDNVTLGPAPSGLFLQLLETQTEGDDPFSDLDSAANRWLADSVADAKERIVGFGPRLFMSAPPA